MSKIMLIKRNNLIKNIRIISNTFYRHYNFNACIKKIYAFCFQINHFLFRFIRLNNSITIICKF